jgi:UDP-GlcNAc:undecaprenyl-phosphate GlcNAc-1-phosphate transferase
LYCLTGFLCGVVLLGVALNNPVQGEFLALILGVSGCLAFLVILTSRRDELASLTRDLKSRFARKRQERSCARLTWDAIQKIELCDDPDRTWQILSETARAVGCTAVALRCERGGREVICRNGTDAEAALAVSGATATFRLRSGADLRLAVTLHQAETAEVEPDIAFRSLQRLALAIAERLERHFADASRSAARPVPCLEVRGEAVGAEPLAPVPFAVPAVARHGRDLFRWVRWAVGWRGAALERRGWLGEK